jgi:MFS transporter, DHA3 family, macrolide efflux protein
MTQAIETPKNMRTFFIIWSGQVISLLGSGLTSFALGVWIFQETGQATPFALTVLFGSLPRILLAPLAGSLADRWNRRLLMILSDTGNALVTLVVVFLIFTNSLEVWNIYLVALVGSICGAFQEPAYTASVAMLVPKKDLARASGLSQAGQALEMLVAPMLAGVLFVTIGLRGIILIDFVTYFFAVGALLIVKIRQPQFHEEPGQSGRGKALRDAMFGWNYLRMRTGLFGLLLYFAMVNFLLNFAAVLTGPLVLSFAAATALGAIQMASGLGMLLGSVIMGAWGGPKKRIRAVIGFIALSSLGVVLIGLRANPILIGAGYFILMACIPLASGPSQAIFQTKVAPDVQGRVFAIRAMISRSMMPVAFLIAGPLADFVFEPAMREGGALASTFLADLVGVGPGRGIGLIFISAAVLLAISSVFAYLNPRIRNVESELPDTLPDPSDIEENTQTQIQPEVEPA